MLLLFIGIIIWWCNFAIRIINHARDKQFWRMPWLFLWISTYILGWCYLLNHYSILTDLDNRVLAIIKFPIVALIFVTLIFTYELVSLWIIVDNKRVSFKITLVLLFSLYFFSIFSHFHVYDYLDLYWQNSIVVYISLLIASASLYTNVWQERQFPSSNIEFAHNLWYLIFATLFGAAYLLIAVNGVRGLLGYITTPDTNLQYVAYILNMLGMLSFIIMMLPDDILFKTVYPIRVLQYRRLVIIRDYIYRQLENTSDLLKTNPANGSLDICMHETLISILDYYPFLGENNNIRKDLWDIEQSSGDIEDMIWKIMQIRLDLV